VGAAATSLGLVAVAAFSAGLLVTHALITAAGVWFHDLAPKKPFRHALHRLVVQHGVGDPVAVRIGVEINPIDTDPKLCEYKFKHHKEQCSLK
jgi:hypothetical protein